MSDDDIDKAVREAAEYEAQDKKRKEAVDTKNDADAMVFQTEKALEEAGDKLDANDKTAVEADLNALKELLNSCANTDEIKMCIRDRMTDVAITLILAWSLGSMISELGTAQFIVDVLKSMSFSAALVPAAIFLFGACLLYTSRCV